MGENRFQLRLRRRNIPEQDIIDDIRRVASKLQADSITKVEYDEHGQFGATTLLRRFGSWHKAISAAKLKIVHNVNISNEALFENLADVWQSLGRQPYGREMDRSERHSKYSLGTYEHRFGTWNKALMQFIDYINQGGDAGSNNGSTSRTPRPPKALGRTPRGINWRLRAIVLIRDNCICKMCGNSPAKDSSIILHVDHIIPWSKGGETVQENLQTLCHKCNIGKSDLL